MKKRLVLWLLPCLLLLAAAFLGPGLLLRREQSSVLDRRWELDASAYLLETDSGDYVQKLMALGSFETQYIEMKLEAAELRTIRETLADQINTLTALELLPAPFPTEMILDESAAFQARLQCVINPELGILFELYEISMTPLSFTARMDRSSGRLLSFSFMGNLAAMQNDVLLAEPKADWAVRCCEAWGAYYGMNAKLIRDTLPEELLRLLEETSPRFAVLPLLVFELTDPGGNAIQLGFTYFCEYTEEKYAFGSNFDEIQP